MQNWLPDSSPQYAKPIPPEIYSVSVDGNTILFTAQSKKKLEIALTLLSDILYLINQQILLALPFKIYSEAH